MLARQTNRSAFAAHADVGREAGVLRLVRSNASDARDRTRFIYNRSPHRPPPRCRTRFYNPCPLRPPQPAQLSSSPSAALSAASTAFSNHLLSTASSSIPTLTLTSVASTPYSAAQSSS